MMPLSFILIFVYFLERYDYLTFRKWKSKKEELFFDTSLIFSLLFSFNYVKTKKGAKTPISQRKSIYLQTK